MLEIDVTSIKKYLLSLQESLCHILSEEDGKAFAMDQWQSQLGSGITGVLENGHVIERGGVNFSHVIGNELPKAATLARPELTNKKYEALGISVVIHPVNPFVPSMHANVRFFKAENVFWFGGGFDLTPYYGFEEDCVHWHRVAKNLCDPFGEDVYPRFKKSCDEYFYLKHRNEPRGIGGLFFDDLNLWGFEKSFEFIKAVGNNILPAYQPILSKRKHLSYTEKERAFQLYRRGRYVEFNLVQDRGTLFGLQSGGRTESILMSLPPKVEWRYDWRPDQDSQEAELYNKFLKPKDWVNHEINYAKTEKIK